MVLLQPFRVVTGDRAFLALVDYEVISEHIAPMFFYPAFSEAHGREIKFGVLTAIVFLFFIPVDLFESVSSRVTSGIGSEIRDSYETSRPDGFEVRGTIKQRPLFGTHKRISFLVIPTEKTHVIVRARKLLAVFTYGEVFEGDTGKRFAQTFEE